MSSITVTALNENNGELSFTLGGVDTSVANAIRRTIMSDIKIIVFRTFGENNDVSFTVNTSRLNNEILSQRLACIPIHVLPDNDEYNEDYKISDLLLVVEEENSTDVVRNVTTEDFKIKRISTGEFLSKEKCREFFKPYIAPNGKEYFIQFCRLRPRISDEIPGEKLAFTCKFSYGSASDNSMYNVVGTCAYGFTVDEDRAETVLKNLKEEWRKNGLDVERESTNWELLEKKRISLPNSFDFIIGSVGAIPNGVIMTVACGRLITRFVEIIKTIDDGTMQTTRSDMTNDLSVDYILENNDYTVGCVLNSLLFSNYYERSKTLQYCGFKKIHPHDTHSVIRMMFTEKEEDSSSSPKSIRNSKEAENKDQVNNYSPPYSTTEPLFNPQMNQGDNYSPPYSTTEPLFNPQMNQEEANNYSPPYSTTEPLMKGGNSKMYESMGFGYIKKCCQEAIQTFEKIAKLFDNK
jgi:hypothetical protein